MVNLMNNEFVGIYAKIPKYKAEKFKRVVKKIGKVQEFAISEALDEWAERVLASLQLEMK